MWLYLCSIRPVCLTVQQCVEGVSQKLLPLWTVAADDVTGGTDALEEIHADRWGGDSRGDVSQVHVDGDFLVRGGLRACDQRKTFQKPELSMSHSHVYPFFWYLDRVRSLLVLYGCWMRACEQRTLFPSWLRFGRQACFSLSSLSGGAGKTNKTEQSLGLSLAYTIFRWIIVFICTNCTYVQLGFCPIKMNRCWEAEGDTGFHHF